MGIEFRPRRCAPTRLGGSVVRQGAKKTCGVSARASQDVVRVAVALGVSVPVEDRESVPVGDAVTGSHGHAKGGLPVATEPSSECPPTDARLAWKVITRPNNGS